MNENTNGALQYQHINEKWNPIQVAQHYQIPIDSLTGKYQKVAIMALGQPPPQDVLQQLIDLASGKRYKGRFSVLQLPADKSDSSWKTPTSTGEYAMDAQIIGTLCPEADITIIAGEGSLKGMADVIDKAVEQNCKVLTSSIGFVEESVNQYSNLMASDIPLVSKALDRAQASNMTVFVAAGDSGSGERQVNHAVAGPQGQVHVGVMASLPGVVCCGGTEMRKENGKPVETAWNNSNLYLDDPQHAAGAGTGGVSRYEPLPSWQNAHKSIVHANTGKNGRIVPDLSAAASFVDWDVWEAKVDPQKGTPNYGKWATETSSSGGTSTVAPFYAAMFTLINQQRTKNDKDPVGWINQWLYENAPKSDWFNDITQGDNRPRATYDSKTQTFTAIDTSPGYDAGSGYDACTGWGSPTRAFFDALVGK